jgi:hypothetical protein
VVDGYEESVYEYANDVDSRAILDRVASSASPEAREALLRWLRPWDERYETATRRAVPRRPVGELKSDLQAMGLA